MNAAGPDDPRAPGRRVLPLAPDLLIGTLVEHQVEFIVIGGFAVAAHGHPRGTQDVDICPDPDRANLARLAAALAELEAESLDARESQEFELRPDLEGLVGGGNWTLATRYGRLDVMQVLAGLEGGYADLASGAEERVFLGHPVRFCGYEDLLRMKRAAGRDQDLIDVRDLMAARGELG